MKQCPYCGSELSDEARFCVECGKPLPAEAAPVTEVAPAAAPAQEEAAPEAVLPREEIAPEAVPPQKEAVPEAVPVQKPAAPVRPAVRPAPAASGNPPKASAEAPIVTTVPPKKHMLSTFQYVGLTLLYGLPVIGLVFLFIFGAGHPKNMSTKRFSAAMLILRLAFWIVVLVLLILAMVRNARILSYAINQMVPAVKALLEAIFS